MNKGKVRDSQFAARKKELISKILNVLEKTKGSAVAKSLAKKGGTRLAKIYDRLMEKN